LRKRSIHVFATDFLPFPGGQCTAGGLRGSQIINALRQAGHRVTCSMPLTTHAARTEHALTIELSADERWLCEHFFEPDVVLNRVEPDIAIYGNIEVLRSVRRFSREIVQIADLNGPIHMESLLMKGSPPALAALDGEEMERASQGILDRLRDIDYVMTVSERQKFFWLAFCSVAGFSLADLEALVCPFSFAVPEAPRRISPELTVVHAGGFYPWQEQTDILRSVACLLDRVAGARLHIVGGPHKGLPNEQSAEALIGELQAHPSVRYHGFCSFETLTNLLSSAWMAIDLMHQSLERELAINARTIHFLKTGTPVIYNPYSTLSALIEKYRAGWTVSPSDTEGVERVFQEIVRQGPELIRKLSGNALELSRGELEPNLLMKPLVDLCGSVELPSRRSKSRTPAARPMARALCLSQDTDALVKLRIGYPLEAVMRAGRLGGLSRYGIASDDLRKLRQDDRHYDVVVIQRSLPALYYRALSAAGVPFVLDVDDNLLAAASYRREGMETALVVGLSLARALTVPNPRLIRMLEKYSGLRLGHKAFVTPNSLPFPSGTARAQQPSQLLWIQSDIAALGDSREAVVRAVEDFSRRNKLPVLLIGRTVIDNPRFTYQKILGQIPFDENLRLLANSSTSIGIAPLETSADEETLDFISGKSDLKLLLFAGYGHPGVYSSAPPYEDSPLRQAGILVGNTYAEWTEALDYQYREGWRHIAAEAANIRERRASDRVALESWIPALEAGRLADPVRGTTLHQAVQAHERAHPGERLFGDGESDEATVAVRTRLLEHHVKRLRAELAAHQNSYSWRISAPLRALAKTILPRTDRQS
jgi:glycosyltransferase involved in cell wall biosynthesis